MMMIIIFFLDKMFLKFSKMNIEYTKNVIWKHISLLYK